MNTISIIGRLTADPELKRTESGLSVVAFTTAVDVGFGEKKHAAFIDCVAWRGTAEFISRNFTKGKQIAITGHLDTRTWDDKEGKKHKSTEIIVDEVDFCGTADRQNRPDNKEPEFVPVNDDDLPF